MLVLDPDTHPSEGKITFGDPDQEIMQIAAFCKLEELSKELLSATVPSEAARQAAKQRAAAIKKLEGNQFVPSSGFCFSCDSDITKILEGVKSATGCPVCFRTWCD